MSSPPAPASGTIGRSSTISDIQKRHASGDQRIPMEALEKLVKAGETGLFPFTDFLKQHGQEQKKGLFRKRMLSVAEIAAFTTRPLETSLLKHAEASQSKLAVELQQQIYAYLTRPRSLPDAKDAKSYELPKRILHFGLTHDWLRDETYGLLLKCTTPPPAAAAASDSGAYHERCEGRAWELLTFVTCLFCPSSKFLKYVAAHLFRAAFQEPKSPELKRKAAFCLWSLQQNLQALARKMTRSMPPSIMELDALCAVKPIVCSVALPDGTAKGVYIDSYTTVEEVLLSLVERLGLKHNTEEFGILEVYNESLARSLPKSGFLSDVLASFEALTRSMSSGKKRPSLKFVFKRRLYLDTAAAEYSDPVERQLMFHQTWDDLKAGRLYVDEIEALNMAALLLQYRMGDYSSGFVPKLHDYIPADLLASSSREPADWNSDLMANHMMVMGTSKEQAMAQFLAAAQRLPFFGTTVVAGVAISGVLGLPAAVHLRINARGFCACAQPTAEPILDYTYSDLVEARFDPDKNELFLAISQGDGVPYLNVAVQARANTAEVYRLLVDYRAAALRSSVWAQAIASYTVNDPSLLAFQPGDYIYVIEKDLVSGWYRGRLGDATGIFPCERVRNLITPPSPDQLERQDAALQLRHASALRLSSSSSSSSITASPLSPRVGSGAAPFVTPPEWQAFIAVHVASSATAVSSSSSSSSSTTASSSSSILTLRRRTKTIGRGERPPLPAALLSSGSSSSSSSSSSSPIFLQFSESPQRHPLLKEIDPSEYDKAAEMSTQLMRVMGDYPLASGQSALQAHRRLFEIVLHGSKNLQIEFYVQLYAQLLGNGRATSVHNGWSLFVLAAGIVCPAVFRPVAAAIFRQLASTTTSPQLSDLAAIGSARLAELESLRQDVHRRQPPSSREQIGIVNQTMVISEISIIGRSSVVPVAVSPTMTTQNVVDMVCTKLQISHRSGYTVWVHSQALRKAYPCSPADLFMDALSVAEAWHVDDVRFYLKRLIWLDEGFSKANLVDDPQDLYITFAWVTDDIRSGRLPVTALQAVRLAAVLMAHDFGPARKNVQRVTAANLAQYVPHCVLGDKSEADWLRELDVVHQLEPEKPQQDLKLKYLDMAFKLDLWGAIWFPVAQKHKKTRGAQEHLVLTPRGVGIYYEGCVEPAAGQFWSYASISLVTADAETFSITVGNLQRPERYTFYTDQPSQIGSVFREFSRYAQNAKNANPLAAL